jgi:hypothetical protein
MAACDRNAQWCCGWGIMSMTPPAMRDWKEAPDIIGSRLNGRLWGSTGPAGQVAVGQEFLRDNMPAGSPGLITMHEDVQFLGSSTFLPTAPLTFG